MSAPVLALWFALSASTAQPAELVWTDLRGHEQRLEGFRGRIVVLNFWATWCAPCRKEMPDLVRIQKRYGMYGVQVVGASADEASESAAVEEFARRHKINFPILVGATTQQMLSLNVGEALPATLVIDREGRVVERVAGVFDPAELEAVLERLLAAGSHDHGEEEHDHGEGGHEHGHPPSEGTQASLVPS